MSTTITGKLNKAANQFQAGESTGFGMRLGVQYYDRETKQKEWTNYEFVVFAKAPQQVQFYQQALIEGAVVEVTAASQKIKEFQGQNGTSLSIELIDAKLGLVHTGQQPQQQQASQQQPQQLNQQAMQQPPASFGNQPQHQQSQQFQQPQDPRLGQGVQQREHPGVNDLEDEKIPF